MSRFSTLTRILKFTGVSLVLILLAGCQSVGRPGSIPTGPAQKSSPPPTAAPFTRSPQITPSLPVELPKTPTVFKPTETKTSSATPLPSPFSFPTPTGRTFSVWRPAAYPIPWALNPYDHFYFSRPIAAQDIDSPFSNYGYGDVFFENVVHTGIDIPGEIGTPIYAAGPGKVIWAGYGYYRGGSNILDDPYGQAVAIKHSFGYQSQPLYTVYAHLDEIKVLNGQQVQAGDLIGLMGETGHATGPHLHFEVRLGEDSYFATRNPNLWLAPPQGWGLLVGQIRNWDGRLLELRDIYLHSQLDPKLQNTAQDQLWIARTYQNEAIHSDPHYQENLVFPDLPAGTYQVNIPYPEFGLVFTHEVEIHPGKVTYFQFELWEGFSDHPPPTPEVKFTPAP
jgi:murein DD-endopeptidase MepM/ murein hydrolase activator NlpD